MINCKKSICYSWDLNRTFRLFHKRYSFLYFHEVCKQGKAVHGFGCCMFTVAIDLIVHHIWDILHSKNGESASGQHPYIENRRSSTWSDALSRWLTYNRGSLYFKENTFPFFITLCFTAHSIRLCNSVRVAIWIMKILHILIMMNFLLIVQGKKSLATF